MSYDIFRESRFFLKDGGYHGKRNFEQSFDYYCGLDPSADPEKNLLIKMMRLILRIQPKLIKYLSRLIFPAVEQDIRQLKLIDALAHLQFAAIVIGLLKAHHKHNKKEEELSILTGVLHSNLGPFFESLSRIIASQNSFTHPIYGQVHRIVEFSTAAIFSDLFYKPCGAL